MGAPLETTRVLVLDCQTTGAAPDKGSLLEVAYAVADGLALGTVESRILRLPDGEKLTRLTQQLTGLTPRDLDGAVEPAQALQDLITASKQVPTRLPGGIDDSALPRPSVIHFARFEQSFLRELHFRFRSDESFFLDVVCTHEIALRLHPELPRRGLRALAGYYGHPLGTLRRSRDHVEATFAVWQGVLRELNELGISDWSGLRDFLARPKVSAKRTYPMSRSLRLELPDRPGVYRLKRVGGSLLYVGKATSLRDRVNAHFRKQSGQSERTLEMLSQARDVEWTETPSALEAALLETDEIKRLNPPYNVALMEKDRGLWYSARDLWSWREQPGEPFVIGPLPAPRAVQALAALRILATGHPPDPGLMAASLGIPVRELPETEVFVAGFEQLQACHSLRTFRAILRLAVVEEPSEEEEASEAEAPLWTPELVKRSLERSAETGAELLRRSRELARLAESQVTFTDVRSSSESRTLTIRGGRIEGAQNTAFEFDLATYDRMRVLLTELRLIRAAGGAVSIAGAPSGILKRRQTPRSSKPDVGRDEEVRRV